ncbi:ras GTPase-activating protein 3-like [Dysidea avara]|uniref:ras GTPase-activating protein 3-like n=1 Tax=Dysidea avara TaxID=196820 RepID=UPI00332C0EA2
MALEVERSAANVGRVEKTILFRIGEVKNLSSPHDLRSGRDVYVVAALDQEEIFRTATVERSLNPFYGEEFNFEVPRDFQFLSFYVYDSDCYGLLRDVKLGKVRFKCSDLQLMANSTDMWYPLQPIDHDSEVQGKIHLHLSIDRDDQQTISIGILDCCCLGACLASGHSDPYCLITLLYPDGVRSEAKRTQVKKKTIDPQFNEFFTFTVSTCNMSDVIIRVSLWHQSLLTDDTFLGQVNLAPMEMVPGELYDVWVALVPRQETPTSPRAEIGSIRLTLQYRQNFIYSSEVYEPLKALLFSSLKMKDITSSPLYLFGQVCQNRSLVASVLVNIFLKDGQIEKLVEALVRHEVKSTTDCNTLFRGNSLVTKVVDELIKKISMSYLQRTLQSIIDEIFEARKNCEVDPSKLVEGDNLEMNLTTLLFYVERIFSAITASSVSCPRLMCRIFSIIRQAAVDQFPDQANVVQYTAVSAFVFLRLFAPAILNPKLFGLRPEYANVTVARTLTLISKTLQNLANISQKSGSMRKEPFMLMVYDKVADDHHHKTIKLYLSKVSDPLGGEADDARDTVHREGYMVKRGQARKKFGLKNFKTRYFVLTNNELTYAKEKGDKPLCFIPIKEIQAIERVDEEAFGMKFMMQVVQEGGRILYLKAKNTVELMEWLAILLWVTNCTHYTKINTYHSGAYLAGNWTCCHDLAESAPGCKPISLACQLLSRRTEIDQERELNTLCTMLFSEKSKLEKMKSEAEEQARVTNEITEHLHILCELTVFLSNMEVMVGASKEQCRLSFGTKQMPLECSPVDACVIK